MVDLGTFTIIMVILIIVLILINIVVEAATSKGRSAWAWGIFAFFCSPLVALLALICLGDTDKRRLEKIEEEARLRQAIREKNENSN